MNQKFYDDANKVVLPIGVKKRLMECEGYLELKMVHKARAVFDELPAIYKQDKMALLMECRIKIAEGNWQNVRELATELLKKDANSSEYWIILASAERRAGSLEKSISILEEAALKFPKCAVIFYNLACYYALLSKKQKACQLLKQAFKLDDNLINHALSDPDLKGLGKRLFVIAAKSLKPKE